MVRNLEGRAGSPEVSPCECEDLWIQPDTGAGVWTKSQTGNNDPLGNRNSLTESHCGCLDNKNYADKQKKNCMITFLAALSGNEA